MKIILKNEVHNLGLPGDVVDVADGYGRNYLIPQGLAIRATAGAMKEAEGLTRSRLAQEAKTIGDARLQAAAIEALVLKIGARVDDSGNLYGSVAVGDVERVLKERGFAIDKRRIDLKGALKKIGTYEIPVQVHPQVTATATVEVVDADGKVGVGGIDLVELAAKAARAAAEAASFEEIALAAADVLEDAEAAEASAEAEAATAPAAEGEEA